MRILLKCPTRSRPQRVLRTLAKYMELAAHPEQIGVAVSCDTDDETMRDTTTLDAVLSECAWHKVFYSDNHTKIEACNANMNEIDYPWDIVVLVSDDMIPQVKGYDEFIRSGIPEDTDGILWCNDGAQGTNLNTLTIMGRTMYNSFGYLYHPAYKSLFCDTEFTDLCNTTLKPKCVYLSECIIRHEHPQTGYGQNMDDLYRRNDRYFWDDLMTYVSRKTYTFDWSVLIPTLPEREGSLQALLAALHEKHQRICPDIRLEVKVFKDNRENTVGAKRQQLLREASGKYMSFIDDDDMITDAYLEDVAACIRGGFHVMRLRGQMNNYFFVHSLDHKLTDPMFQNGVFSRPPNHLNPMLADVAKWIRFQSAVRGEDLDWAIRLAQSRFLRTEYTPDPGRVHYIYNMGNRQIHPSLPEAQSRINAYQMLEQVFQGSHAPPPSQKEGPRLRLGPKGFVSV